MLTAPTSSPEATTHTDDPDNIASRVTVVAPRGASSSSLSPEPAPGFVQTAEVHSLTERALTYLHAGFPVHLSGPAGTGKTTLAFHIAAQLGRPVSLIHGNHEFGTSDLVGKDSGYEKSFVMDNYITSVVKTQEKLSVNWKDNRLTTACEQGHVLIYDEFNRTPPEANNILLSILEEGILNLPKTGGDSYTRVHPEFRVIFTSNPAEYAGVHQTQDALLDRLITVPVHHYDAATERSITAERGGIHPDDAGIIVALARRMRERSGAPQRPTVRACITLARVTTSHGGRASADDAFFVACAAEIFGDPTAAASRVPDLNAWASAIREAEQTWHASRGQYSKEPHQIAAPKALHIPSTHPRTPASASGNAVETKPQPRYKPRAHEGKNEPSPN